MKMNRRGFNQLLCGAAGASLLSGTSAFARASDVSLIWWGNPERDRRTLAVADLYSAQGHGAILPETYSWPDYWQKLATMAAGNSLPNVLQMDYRFIFEWARRGQLAPLDSFFGNEINTSTFDPLLLKSGVVDGSTYGIPLGANSNAQLYNTRILGDIGMELPDTTTWTVEEFVALGKQVKAELPEGVYWSENSGSSEPRFEAWVRSKGRNLYSADGEITFTADDAIEYFEYWYMMQEEGLTPPADVQAQDSGKMEERMSVNGTAVFGLIPSNQLVATQNLMKDEVDLAMIPNAGDQPAHYMKPSMFFSMANSAADKSAAAKFMSYFVSDLSAAEITLIERGVSADSSVRDHVASALTETERKTVKYLNMVSSRAGLLPPVPPKNAGEVERALAPAWQAVSFKQQSARDGAVKWYDNAARILQR